jgi:DNA-binding NarL/FixJ family response regulator
VRVVIAEDSVLLREGLARLLEEADFSVVGLAGDAEELLRLVALRRPDVALVDLRMPPTQTDEGLRAAQEIRRRLPECGVLVLSQHVEQTYAAELFADGAAGVGYLLKDRVVDVDRFREAVRQVAGGGSVVDPEVIEGLVSRRRDGDPLHQLTPREREALQLVAEGRSNQAIARQLVITERAVEKHLTNVFAKLGLNADPSGHRRVLATLRFLGL